MWWFEKFRTNLDFQVLWSRPKILDSDVKLQTIEENTVSNTRRVSGKFDI